MLTLRRTGLVVPYDYYSQAHDENVRVASEALHGAFEAGMKIETLVLGNVNYRFLLQSEPWKSRLRGMLKHVKYLRWDVGETFVREHDDAADEDDVTYGPDVDSQGLGEMYTIFGDGEFASFISNATNLRTLVVNMPEIPDRRMIPVKFGHVFGRARFPLLQLFSAKNMSTNPQDLARFLTRHKQTLTQLRLCDLHIWGQASVSWHSWFTAMGGKLPFLEKVCLRGGFQCQGRVTHMLGQNLSEYIGTRFSRAMEAFMVRGGEVAPLPRDYYEDSYVEMDREERIEWAGDALVPEIKPVGWDLSWEL